MSGRPIKRTLRGDALNPAPIQSKTGQPPHDC